MEIQMNGFDEFQSKLEKLQQNAENLEGTHEFSLEELFTTKFIKEFTSLSDTSQLLEQLPNIGQEEIQEGSPELDAFAGSISNFDSWNELVEKAFVEYMSDRLFDI